MWSAREKSIIPQSWPSAIRALPLSRVSAGGAEQVMNTTGEARGGPRAGQEYLWLKDRAAVHWVCCCSSFSLLPLALDFLGKQKVRIRRGVWRTSNTELCWLSIGFPITNQKWGQVSWFHCNLSRGKLAAGNKHAGPFTLTPQKARPHCPTVRLCDWELNSR